MTVVMVELGVNPDPLIVSESPGDRSVGSASRLAGPDGGAGVGDGVFVGAVVAVGGVVLVGDGVAVGCGAVVGTGVAVGVEALCVLVGCGFVVLVGCPTGAVVAVCAGIEAPAGPPAVLVGLPLPPVVPEVVGDEGCAFGPPGPEPPPPFAAACVLPVAPDGPLGDPAAGVLLDPARGVALAPAVAVDVTPAPRSAVADFAAPVAELETVDPLTLVLDDSTAAPGSPPPPLPPHEAATTPIVSRATTAAATPAMSNPVRSGTSVSDESPRIFGSRGNRIVSLLGR